MNEINWLKKNAIIVLKITALNIKYALTIILLHYYRSTLLSIILQIVVKWYQKNPIS